jgi:hypothetical protein
MFLAIYLPFLHIQTFLDYVPTRETTMPLDMLFKAKLVCPVFSSSDALTG